jgi:predicted nucleotidyltransferase
MRKPILQILSGCRPQLTAFGVKRIGLFGVYLKDNGSAKGEVDLLVELHREKNIFRNFMLLVTFLEKLLDREVNVLLMQPRSSYISEEILQSAAYIDISVQPMMYEEASID